MLNLIVLPFLGFTLVENGESCQLSNYQQDVDEEWVCRNAIPLIEQEHPNRNKSYDTTLTREESAEHPKGCYIEKIIDDPSNFRVFFNNPPQNILHNQTTETTTSVPNINVNDSSTTPSIPILNSTNLTKPEIRQVCRMMDRKH